MTNTKLGPRRGRDWSIGVLAAFVALVGTMEVAVAQGAAGSSMGSTAETVEASLRAVFEKSGVRAAAWCLVKDGRVISQNGFGFADSAKARHVDAQSTVFRAASNGKVFIDLSALLVEAEGRLDLRADVNSILMRARLPENFDAPVTRDHLLTHTGGFEDRFGGGLAASPDLVVPLGEYLATRMAERVFPPGRWMSYSNHGMALAGLVVEEAAGNRFADLADAKHRPHAVRWQRYEKAQPGHRLQVDVKFLERIPGSTQRFYQFTAIDDCTRIRVLKVFDACNQRAAMQFVDDSLDIRHVYIRPRTPHLNGKVERSHRVDDQEGYQLLDKDGITDDIHLFHEKRREWEDYYNYHRPHGALDGQPRTSAWSRKPGPECHRRLRTLHYCGG